MYWIKETVIFPRPSAYAGSLNGGPDCPGLCRELNFQVTISVDSSIKTGVNDMIVVDLN